jgi:hypothetical protein
MVMEFYFFNQMKSGIMKKKAAILSARVDGILVSIAKTLLTIRISWK